MQTDLGLKYFTHKELKCKKTGIVQLQPAGRPANYPGFGKRIDDLREAWGKPLIVNSCCRSKQHNTDIGGAKGSFHVFDEPFHGYLGQLGTLAIDFSETSEEFRNLAWQMNFSIGLARTFTHCDDRKVLGLPKIQFKY